MLRESYCGTKRIIGADNEVFYPQSIRIADTVNCLLEGKFTPDNQMFRDELSPNWRNFFQKAIKCYDLQSSYFESGVGVATFSIEIGEGAASWQELKDVFKRTFSKNQNPNMLSLIKTAERAFAKVASGQMPEDEERRVAETFVYGFSEKLRSGGYSILVHSCSGVGGYKKVITI